jgi:hypothetical protein
LLLSLPDQILLTGAPPFVMHMTLVASGQCVPLIFSLRLGVRAQCAGIHDRGEPLRAKKKARQAQS